MASSPMAKRKTALDQLKRYGSTRVGQRLQIHGAAYRVVHPIAAKWSVLLDREGTYVVANKNVFTHKWDRLAWFKNLEDAIGEGLRLREIDVTRNTFG